MALTQEDLNKYYVGSDCELAFKYAQIMSTMYVCMTFSTGIPLLYIIAAVNFLLYYVVEKFLFINFYKVEMFQSVHNITNSRHIHIRRLHRILMRTLERVLLP